MTDPGPWFRNAFERGYLTVYAHRDQESADREAAFVAEQLGLMAGERLLDAACGAGRHARALAGRGARVVGVDLSADLLAAARAAGGDVLYVRGDLRALPFRAGAFDHAVSLFTSFGYFDAAGDRAQLRGLRSCLRPDGRFLLDFLNAPAVTTGLVPVSRKEVRGREITERRSIEAGRVVKRVDVAAGADGAAPVTWTESVRLYEREETEALLVEASFRVCGVHGDLGGGAWSATSPRLVVLAEAA